MNRLILHTIIVLLTTVFNPTIHSATPSYVWEDGHGDLEVSYMQGEWIWTLEQGKTPDSVVIKLGATSLLLVPDLADFEFLGEPDAPVWIIPQSAQAGVPFMGIASETPSGTFVDNMIQLKLTQLDGPGQVFAWSVGETQVELDISSSDGLDTLDQIMVPAPGHIHRNIGFTAPGTYRLSFVANAIRTDTGQPVESAPIEILVEVSVIESGEVDLELLYESDGWELELLDEETESESETSLAVFQLKSHSRQIMPAGLGTFEDNSRPSHLYVLPADQDPGLPFIGIATDELEKGVFLNEDVSLNLVGKEGPGEVFLYSKDPFGNLNTLYDTSDGLNAEDVIPLKTGEHLHYNIGFTEPGRYTLFLQPAGQLLNQQTVSSADSFELLFEAIAPETTSNHPPFEIHLTHGEEDTFLIQWKSEKEQAYQLQTRSSFDSSTWLDEGSIIEGTGEIMQHSLEPVSETMHFYRLITR